MGTASTVPIVFCYKLIEVINRSNLVITKGENSNGGIAYYAKEVHSGTTKINIVNLNDYLFWEDNDKIYQAIKKSGQEMHDNEESFKQRFENYNKNIGISSPVLFKQTLYSEPSFKNRFGWLHLITSTDLRQSADAYCFSAVFRK